MQDRHNREGKRLVCFIPPTLSSSSHALSFIQSTCFIPQFTVTRLFSSTPTETLSQPETLLRLASKPSRGQPGPSTLALPQALVLSFQASPCQRSQLTIARTIRIFRGIMTGLVKHSCPWKSLIFLAAAQSVPRRAEVWQGPFSPARLCPLMLAHTALPLRPVTAQALVPSRDTASRRCGTALSSLQAPS